MYFYKLFFFWVIKPNKLFKTDVSGILIGPMVKGQAVQEDSLSLEARTDGQFRNVVLNNLTLCNNPEDGKVLFNCGGSLR